jgi:hypothetical protein
VVHNYGDWKLVKSRNRTKLTDLLRHGSFPVLNYNYCNVLHTLQVALEIPVMMTSLIKQLIPKVIHSLVAKIHLTKSKNFAKI